jgi:hypothetical protein
MGRFLLVFMLLWGLSLFGQNDLGRYAFVKKISDQIELDGKLEEPFWLECTPSSQFIQYFPNDTTPATSQTEFYMAYDDEFLYVGVKCRGLGNDWRVNTLRRDYRAGGNDNITFVFDSFSDETNAYFFGINPEGVIREGVITRGGNSFANFDESWDNKWWGEAHIFDGYYTAELKIPFGALRFSEGSKQWKLGAYRFDTQANEWTTWTGIPNNLPLVSLAKNGIMEWEEPIYSKRKSFSFIPFIASTYSRDFENDTSGEFNPSIGGDAKIGITSGLNLDLTVNPDFSQVEVDRQITDLSRFEIFFPERRQFFLENADLFGEFGFNNINPFFSRRIGVGSNDDGETVQNRIYGGARLSGKLNDKTRIGLLNVQTANDLTNGISGANFSVLALQQQVLGRSNISFIGVNKLVSARNAEELGQNRYNRVFGVDFNYANEANTLFGKTFTHASFTPDQTSTPISHGAELNYSTRAFGLGWRHEHVSEDYNAEVGFIRRSNYWSASPRTRLTFYPRNDVINQYEFELASEFIWQPELGLTDRSINFEINAQLPNTARVAVGVSNTYIFLFDDFDPTGTESLALPADTEYNYINFFSSIRSDGRKDLQASLRTFIGGYFNGSRYGFRGDVTWRNIPKASVAINYNYNLFDVPHLEGTRSTFLIGPRIDYTFSKEVFFTTFLQYNTQSKNTNINSRFQWRFAPVSDLFIVYTDNYFTGNPGDPSDRFAFDIRNRSIVLKVTYWLNS